ncbi:MAG: diguanylate cyclase [Negativicutes bacterium]|nr:diguanylate cyclase [Negativicutes bacterium]
MNWIIISAVPESLLMTEVYQSIQMTIILMIIAILLSILFFYIIIRRLLKPMGNLLKVADNISSGNLADRAVIFRNDEIGRLSGAFNEMAENLYDLINNLEDTVKTRTEDMKTSKDQLRLLLDSAAEAIYGIDLEGNCTFCNTSCIKLLGYSGQEDLLGENMHRKIHHSKIDGTPFSAEECKIMKSIRQNEGTHSDDEVFWKEDGTFFYVEYHAYPQIKNEKIVGAVITFTDITGRRKREAEIKYLSCHDTLTGLHNRRCFEENLKKLDNPDNLPLSVIFADINGLKMTNDIFGHSAGDALIKKSSEILMEACRKDGSVARVGGDEFVMILPKATNEDAMKVLSNIKDIFSDSRIAAIKCSIALGSNTKTNSAQPIEEVLSSAENAMYKDKALNRKSFNMDIINTIIETLHNRSPKEKQHSITVEEICGSIGSAMDLPDTEIKRLKQAGFLHDIGKIVLEEHLLSKADLSEEELEKMQQHPVIGYRILNLFDTTLDLSEGVYSHHERWDGKGYPKGLKGREIPLLSRIISIGETYERVLSSEENPNSAGREKAIQVIIDGAGKQFDPQIVDLFVQMMNKQ